VTIAMARKVAPKGLPTWLKRLERGLGSGVDILVFRRNSWVIAIPILAKERAVRSQARKVRSVKI